MKTIMFRNSDNGYDGSYSVDDEIAEKVRRYLLNEMVVDLSGVTREHKAS